MSISNESSTEALCLSCGLCCNGAIFADVKLQEGDDADRLRELGLPLRSVRNIQKRNGESSKFSQPCHAHDGCRCGIYAERPRYCREFECVLFKNVAAGRTTQPEALRIIGVARQHSEAARHLLRELGDENETIALSTRFRHMRRRLEQGSLDEVTAELYGRLTLAVHDLNLIISEAFYPGRVNPSADQSREGVARPTKSSKLTV